MRVRIEYTVEVGDDFRRAINHHYGEPGLASRNDVKLHFRQYGHSVTDDLLYDLQVAEEEDDE